MFVIIGVVVLFASLFIGYTMHGGNLSVLLQFSEMIIIIGAATGATLIGNPPSVVRDTFRAIRELIKGNPYNKAAYEELLRMFYQLFQLARREGLVALEKHVETPETSEFFSEFPFFTNTPHGLTFLADTMKVVLTGAVEPHDLSEVLEVDLETRYEASMVVPSLLARVADAMPGFGIVAAILGVVITMGSIGGEAAVVGHKVAAALVGTFLGILLAYGVFAPLGQGIENQIRAEHQYLACLKTAILAFARGDSPLTCAEFARRSIEPANRPTFTELEAMTSGRK